jgi:hypothetical protein
MTFTSGRHGAHQRPERVARILVLSNIAKRNLHDTVKGSLMISFFFPLKGSHTAI